MKDSSCAYTVIQPEDEENAIETKHAVSRAVLVQPKKRSSNCCFKFCLAFVAVIFALALLASTVMYMYIAGVVRYYTVVLDKPYFMFPDTSNVPESEVVAFKDKAAAFFDDLSEGEKIVPDDLVVTEPVFNRVLDTTSLPKESAYAKFLENKIHIELSMPMDRLPGGKGRYFVAKQTWKWISEDKYVAIDTHILSDTEGRCKQMFNNLSDDHQIVGSDCMVNLDYGFKEQEFKEGVDECENLDDESCAAVQNVVDRIDSVLLEKAKVVLHAKRNAENKVENRMLKAIDDLTLKSYGWKLHVARRLLGF